MKIGKKIIPRTAIDAVRQLFNIVDASGLSYGELSDKIGIHRNTLSYWKNGTRSPSLQQFENSLNALGYRIVICKQQQ